MEDNKSETPPAQTPPAQTDYIEALKKMRENTVSKEDYNNLKKDNKKLLQALINGESIDLPAATGKEEINKLRKELLDADEPISNLEYAEKAIKLRDMLIEAGENDPFLPYGHKISPTQEDMEAAKRVADCLKECIKYADGDSTIFTNELQRIMIDTAPPRSAKQNRRR